MLTSVEFPPEKTGYAMRVCNLNVKKEQIEIRRNKHVENVFPLQQLKGIILSNHARALIKYLSTSEKPSLFCVPEVEKLIKCQVIPVQVMLIKGSVDLIMPSFDSYLRFSEAYDEIVKMKSNIKSVVRYLEANAKI